MDQVAVLRAVQNLIKTNASTLVSGLTHQGQARGVKTVAVSVLVAPDQYYFFVVQVRRVTSEAMPSRNIREPGEKCTYNMVVHIADVAIAQAGEELPYEDMTLDFRRMTDRFIAVMRSTRCFSAPSPDNENKFCLPAGPGRNVTVTNSDRWWSDDMGNGAAMLYSTVEFNLEETFAV